MYWQEGIHLPTLIVIVSAEAIDMTVCQQNNGMVAACANLFYGDVLRQIDFYTLNAADSIIVTQAQLTPVVGPN